MKDSRNSKKRLRTVAFTHGLIINDERFGWYNGELYHLRKDADLKKVKVGKKGGFRIFGETYVMDQLKAMTLTISWRFRTDMTWEEMRPVFEGTKLVFGKR
jgi:hypothetical protein